MLKAVSGSLNLVQTHLAAESELTQQEISYSFATETLLWLQGDVPLPTTDVL